MTIAVLVTEGVGSYGDVAHVITDGLDISGVVVTAPATILTEGFGTLSARSPFVVIEGFGSGVTPTPPPTVGGAGGLITFLAWKSPTEAGIEKAKLELKLRKDKEKLEKIERKIVRVEKKVAKQTVPDGVLANLGSLRERAAELRKNIEITAVDLIAVRDFLLSLNFDDDEEDVEILLMGL